MRLLDKISSSNFVSLPQIPIWKIRKSAQIYFITSPIYEDVDAPLAPPPALTNKHVFWNKHFLGVR